VAYGCQQPGQAACGNSDPFTTGRLWDKVREWEAAHASIAGGELQPSAGWQVPASNGWYLEQALYAEGGKTPGSVDSDGGVVVPDGSIGPDPNQDGGTPSGDGGGGGDDGGGCGCRTAPANGAPALVLALIAVFASRRRRSS
jgi:MYXO-CTERM domain-containing protein